MSEQEAASEGPVVDEQGKRRRHRCKNWVVVDADEWDVGIATATLRCVTCGRVQRQFTPTDDSVSPQQFREVVETLFGPLDPDTDHILCEVEDDG